MVITRELISHLLLAKQHKGVQSTAGLAKINKEWQRRLFTGRSASIFQAGNDYE